MAYFTILIIFSLWHIGDIWSPFTIDTDKNNSTGTKDNQSNSNVTTEKEENNTTNQSPLQPKNDEEEKEREKRLLGLSIYSGIIGASLYSITSISVWFGQRKLQRSYFLWYLAKPPIGASLAVIVYLLLRASLLTGIANGSAVSQSLFINDFGVAG